MRGKVVEKAREKVMEEVMEKARERVMERAREEVVEKAMEKVMEKARERVMERAREEVMERARERVAEGLVGVSILRHGKGDGVHHGRQQVVPDGGGVPCSSDELVEQGNLFVRGGVCCQELLEVDLNRFDLGRVIGPRGCVLRCSLVLHPGVVGRGGVGRWQALQPPPVLDAEVYQLVWVDLTEALPSGASPAHAVPCKRNYGHGRKTNQNIRPQLSQTEIDNCREVAFISRHSDAGCRL